MPSYQIFIFHPLCSYFCYSIPISPYYAICSHLYSLYTFSFNFLFPKWYSGNLYFAVLFMCYGFCQKFIQTITGTSTVDDLSVTSNASAGFLASFFSSLAICPTELVKCKLQAMHEVRKQEELLGRRMERVGPVKLTASIVRNEGLVGLFRGLVPTLAREMPGYFFFFGGYEGKND